MTTVPFSISFIRMAVDCNDATYQSGGYEPCPALIQRYAGHIP